MMKASWRPIRKTSAAAPTKPSVSAAIATENVQRNTRHGLPLTIHKNCPWLP